MYPLVTIVIPFYNCPYISAAIASALNQTYPNLEIIVVNDGSTRHTDLIAPYMHRIRYLGKSNGGTASAMNMGIGSSSGKYIAWLSSDDMFKPDKIMRQLAFMRQIQSAFSFSAYATMDHTGQIIRQFEGTEMKRPNDIYRLLAAYNPINGCTTLIEKRLFLQYGFFNEKLTYTHDYDMWVRLALNGVRPDYLPEALTIYRFHDQMGSVRHRPELIAEFMKVHAKYRAYMEQLVQIMP